MIDPESVEEGDIVQWENKYYAAAVVEVKEDLSDEKHVKYEVEVLDPIFGAENSEGDTFVVGRIRKQNFSQYGTWKFKSPGEMTDYLNSAGLEAQRRKMENIKQKYD
jgi:hypothetical protein